MFDWEIATESVVRVMERILADSTDAGFFWNVNLPDLSTEAAGSELSKSSDSNSGHPQLMDCALGRGHLPVEFVSKQGTLTYRGVYQDRPRESGDDVDVCFGGNVAVTKMSIW